MNRKAVTLYTAAFIYCTAGIFPANAAENLNLKYDVYAGGAHAASAEIKILKTDKTYKTDFALEITGLMRHVYPWKGTQTVSGKIGGKRFIPSRFIRISEVYGETKTTDMKYDKKGNLVSSETRITEDDEITQYPDDISAAVPRDSYDLLTAITSVFYRNLKKSDNPCSARIPIFDGKRRFDLVLSPLGTEKIGPNRYSVFSGNTYKCSFDLDMKSEKDRKKNKFFKTIKKSRDNSQVPTVWLGKPDKKSPLVPVKAAVYSDYGSVVIHLGKLSE